MLSQVNYETVPDNYDAFEELEAEQERWRRMRRRLAYAYGDCGREEEETDEIWEPLF